VTLRRLPRKSINCVTPVEVDRLMMRVGRSWHCEFTLRERGSARMIHGTVVGSSKAGINAGSRRGVIVFQVMSAMLRETTKVRPIVPAYTYPSFSILPILLLTSVPSIFTISPAEYPSRLRWPTMSGPEGTVKLAHVHLSVTPRATWARSPR